MIYRYVYKITLTEGNWKDHFYYGQHTTTNLNDGYKGTGNKVLKYYKKYPNNFIKEIISFHNTKEELNKAEYDIIHSYLNDPMCLNLMEGGTGGALVGESLFKMKESRKGQPAWNKGKKTTEETKQKQSQSKLNYYKTHEGYWTGKQRSDETKEKCRLGSIGKHHNKQSRDKISKNNAKYWTGKQRSDETKEKCRLGNLGAKWMTNGTEHHYVSKDKINHYLNLGYHFGRK